MTLLQLQYFIAVVETGNFTHAARQVYTSQPTISRQVQMLEDELGYSLFNRNSKPLRLTEPGQILYEGMKEAISQINVTLEKAKTARRGKRGYYPSLFNPDIIPNICFSQSLTKPSRNLSDITDSKQ